MTSSKKTLIFYAIARNERGKGPAYRMREKEGIPAILYGPEINEMLSVDGKKAAKVLHSFHGHNVMAQLEITDNGNVRNLRTIVKEVQYDPLTHEALHIDFYLIPAGQKVTLSVPLKFIGESPGVKEGGVLEQELWEVDVEGLPDSIPTELEVDLSHFTMGAKFFVKDLKLPPEVSFITDEEHLIANVIAPRAATEPTEAEEAAVAEASEQKEPEIISQEAAEERRKEKEAKKAEQSGS